MGGRKEGRKEEKGREKRKGGKEERREKGMTGGKRRRKDRLTLGVMYLHDCFEFGRKRTNGNRWRAIPLPPSDSFSCQEKSFFSFLSFMTLQTLQTSDDRLYAGDSQHDEPRTMLRKSQV